MNIETMTKAQLAEMAVKLQEELNAIKAEKENKVKDTTPKNHKVGKPSASRKYVLLAKSLNKWGKVPQQQADIADLLVKNMEVGKQYTEAEVFNFLIDGSGDYTSLYTSKQDPTYLFKYYRGLRNDGKHAGFVARDFIQQID